MGYAAINEAKAKRAAVFRDTVAFYTENPILKAAVESSVALTTHYPEDQYPEIQSGLEKAGHVAVSNDGSFTAASRLSRLYPGKKIGVLNFASASQPGGGVTSGSKAQEECLCRCSTLYPTLIQPRMMEDFYKPNKKAANNLHTDALIYSPGVIICKTDTTLPERLPEDQWVTVDIISCAAPNLQEKVHSRYSGDTGEAVSLSEKALFNLHVRRARHILTVAAANQVDVLVLGAFGCGAFHNDPLVVAKAYASVISEFRNQFEHIEFPILGDRTSANFRAFSQTLQSEQMMEKPQEKNHKVGPEAKNIDEANSEPEIPQPVLGQKIKHKKFGEGEVTEIIADSGRVKICFATETKELSYSWLFKNGCVM